MGWCLFLHLTSICYHDTVYQSNVHKSLTHCEAPHAIFRMAPQLPPSSMDPFLTSYPPTQWGCLPPLIPYSTPSSPSLQLMYTLRCTDCSSIHTSLLSIRQETQLVCSSFTSCSKLYSPCTKWRLAELSLDPTNPSFLSSDNLAIVGRGGSGVIGQHQDSFHSTLQNAIGVPIVFYERRTILIF